MRITPAAPEDSKLASPARDFTCARSISRARMAALIGTPSCSALFGRFASAMRKPLCVMLYAIRYVPATTWGSNGRRVVARRHFSTSTGWVFHTEHSFDSGPLAARMDAGVPRPPPRQAATYSGPRYHPGGHLLAGPSIPIGWAHF